MADENEQKPKFDIGDIVIDTAENKKWIITGIYSTGMNDKRYESAYNSLKMQCRGETFIYALRLCRGNKKVVAPESALRKISE